MKKSLKKRHFALAVGSLALALLAACGGGADPVITKVTVTPALGAVYNGDLIVLNQAGTQLASSKTSATTGSAELSLQNYTADTPLVFKLTLNEGARYFNEKTGLEESVTAANPVSLLTVVPTIVSGQSVGVTALTNVAAKLAGFTASSVVSGSPFTVTSSAIYSAIAQTNLAFGLPSSTNLLAAPVPATSAQPTPADTMGLVLALMAKNTTLDSPAAQAQALAAAFNTNGTVDQTKSASVVEVNAILTDVGKSMSLPVVITAPVLIPTATQLTQATEQVKTVVESVKATGSSGL